MGRVTDWDRVVPGEEVAVGRHTAADGDAVHPVVAAALARRPADAGAHRGELTQRIEGSLGWPGESPAPGSGGLGWPGTLPPPAPPRPARQSAEPFEEAERPGESGAEQPPGNGRRRGWRRLFGSDRAA